MSQVFKTSVSAAGRAGKDVREVCGACRGAAGGGCRGGQAQADSVVSILPAAGAGHCLPATLTPAHPAHSRAPQSGAGGHPPLHPPPLLTCSGEPSGAGFKQLSKSSCEYLDVIILNTYWVYSPHSSCLRIALRCRRFAGVQRESDKVELVNQSRIPVAVWGGPSVPCFMSQWV